MVHLLLQNPLRYAQIAEPSHDFETVNLLL